MKIVLQSIRTGRFFSGPGEWVDDPAQAELFDHGLQAVARMLHLGLEDVQPVPDSCS